MFMPVIGSIYSSMKTMQLNMEWQKRKDNVQLPKGVEEDPKIEQFKRQMEDVRKGNAISAIDGKLKAGGTLTNDELEYLRTNNPLLYQKAVEIRREREQYKRELESCKTKDDVEKLNARKMQNFLSEARAVSNNPNITSGKKREVLEQITRRVMGINNEHTTFIKSKDYSDLPREAELLEEKKRRKTKQASLDENDKDYAKELQDFLKNAFEQLGEKSDGGTVERTAPPEKMDAPATTDAATKTDTPDNVKIYDAKGVVKAEGVANAATAKVKVKISAKA